jgi:hypothetical protein
MSTTTDLSRFGYREYAKLEQIIKAIREQGIPREMNVGVYPMFNMNSGDVFLTNEYCDVAMMNGDKLEMFYSCPECGHEGFRDELEHGELNGNCQEWLKDLEAAA